MNTLSVSPIPTAEAWSWVPTHPKVPADVPLFFHLAAHVHDKETDGSGAWNPGVPLAIRLAYRELCQVMIARYTDGA